MFFYGLVQLWLRGKLKEKQSLVHGGTSGIGVATIQILKLYKSGIFTTVGTNKKKILEVLEFTMYIIIKKLIFLMKSKKLKKRY